MKRQILFTALIAMALSSIINCSGVKFDSGANSSNGQNGAQGGDGAGAGGDGTGGTGTGGDATGNVNQPGTTNPGNNTGNTGGTGTGPNGGDTSNAGGPAGPITGTGNTPVAMLPKLQFIGPPCIRLTNCSVTFRLDKAYASQTEFDWRTDDARYGTPPNPGSPMWGKAGYHYVSTSGHVVFPAGTTEQTVFIRNINPDNVEISIGVVMSKCAYGTLYESCVKFFAP